jgi:hypothetical protein
MSAQFAQLPDPGVVHFYPEEIDVEWTDFGDPVDLGHPDSSFNITEPLRYIFYIETSASPESGIPFFFAPVREDAHRALLAQIEALARPEEDDEPAPSESTIERAKMFLNEARSILERAQLPAPDVYSFDGSIRMVWQTNDRKVKLVIPSEDLAPVYIYHSCTSSYDVQESPDQDSLIFWLEWLSSERNAA